MGGNLSCSCIFSYFRDKNTSKMFGGQFSVDGNLGLSYCDEPHRSTFDIPEAFFNPIECGGLENLSGAGGGLQKPPHLFEVLLVPLTQKMVPNPKTRQDKDVTT